MRKLSTFIISLLAIFFIACGGSAEKPTETPEKGDSKTTQAPKEKKVETDDATLATPKSAIAYQLMLLKKGDYQTLKDCCFTEKAKSGVTKEDVEKAKDGDAAKATIDDLVEKIEEGEADGKKTAKIMMKGGRTLTTLVETDGKWLADTVWFK